MANLKNINLMSQDIFENITPVDDELYAVSASGVGFPSSRYEDLTLGATNTTYTAPANGYFAYTQVDVSNVILYNVSKGYGITITGASGYAPYATLQVYKGDVVKVSYSKAGSLKFIQAEGE